MTDPFTPRIDGDRIFGRGAYDMKAGVAAALIAAREAARLGLAGDVVVAAVADEEHASLGVQEALRHVSADAAVVTEPTELELVVAHKGFVWSEIEITGRSAHGSRPHLGVDAIVKMGPVLTRARAARPSAGRPHPPAARPRVGARVGHRRRRRAVELPGALHPRPGAPHAARRDRRADRGRGRVPAGALPRGGPCVACLPADVAGARPVRDRPRALVALASAVAAEALRAPVRIGGASYWADSAFIASAGVPTVLFGPGGEGAHASNEWVSLADTASVARTLIGLAARVCA